MCAANQALHPEAVNEVAQVYANRYYVPSVANPLNPTTFVHKIHVPVYLACQWTDEQTGGHCPDLAEHFTGTRLKWFTFTNGAHIDSLDPATAERWYDFLSLFVAHRLPALSPTRARAGARALPGGDGGLRRLASRPMTRSRIEPSYAAALAAFEALPPVRVLFDNGAGGAAPGAPGAAFEQSFARFPVPGTQAVSWYLGFGGALEPGVTRLGARRRVHLGSAAPGRATDFSGNTGAGRPVGRVAALPLDAEPARHRALLPDRAAELRTSSWSGAGR